MIRLQLKCLHGDYFDAWFSDQETFVAQAAKGQIGCPHCGETSIEEAPALKPGLYADLTEDQARQMACDTRRMLEAWMAQGAPDKSATTATVSGALAEQAAQIAEPAAELPARPLEDIEPIRPSRRAEERKQRPVHYDC